MIMKTNMILVLNQKIKQRAKLLDIKNLKHKPHKNWFFINTHMIFNSFPTSEFYKSDEKGFPRNQTHEI
jgi:hypothetical protein